MKVQIYTMQTVEEALQVVALGVDQIGITPSSIGLPGEIDFYTAREIVEEVGEKAICVALTVESDLREIRRMALAVQPDILHLCGLENSVPPETVFRLRDLLPDLPIMQAVSVSGADALGVALSYQDAVDYIILDTQAADIAGIGASGVVHDWNISRLIVENCRLPVILAGGLTPGNVREAITKVQPWGVDSLTHTNQNLPQGGFRKDLAKISQFIAAAKDSKDI